MWVQIKLSFFFIEDKTSALFSFLFFSIVKQHFIGEILSEYSILITLPISFPKLGLFMWAVLGTALCLIWILFNHFGFNWHWEARKPAISLPWFCHGTTCCCRNNHINLLRKDKFTAGRLQQPGPHALARIQGKGSLK